MVHVMGAFGGIADMARTWGWLDPVANDPKPTSMEQGSSALAPEEETAMCSRGSQVR